MRILNKIKAAASACVLSLSLVGCSDYLDVSDEMAESLDIEEVFSNPTYTRQWHANLFGCISEYSSIGRNVQSGLAGVWVSMCGETTIGGSGWTEMIGGFTADTAPYHRWGDLYRYIRDAHIFLDRGTALGGIDDLSRITEEEMRRMKAEAKFLIAYSHFSLFELYGPVPVMADDIDPEAKELDFARSSVDEIVNFIDNLLVEVIESGDLPQTIIENPSAEGNDKYNLYEIARPTVTTALALRAKLWVYAASPLFNGGYAEALELQNNDGKQLFAAYDANKWKIAKQRLEDLFRNTTKNEHELFTVKNPDGTINPDESYYQLFMNYNDEILWSTGVNHWHTSMEANTNARDCKGWGYLGVSQELVDAYFMKSGLTIDDKGTEYREEGFSDVVNPCNENKRLDKNVFNMYVNREPRFYASIGYEGKSWHIQPPGKPNYTLGFARGEGSDISSADNPRTGYLPTKLKNRKVMARYDGYPQRWGRPSILFRLADFYLYYAEVCNEINPNDPNIIKCLDEVRKRAGIPGYQELATSGKKNIIGNQALQRKMIQRERQVELAMEGQRYFDIRRWMICGPGEDADQSVFHAMNMNGFKDKPAGDPKSYFTRILLERRAWHRAMYLYPIPQAQIQISKLLVQNPLW